MAGNTIIDLFIKSVETDPQKVAVVTEGGLYCYEDLSVDVNILINTLVDGGVKYQEKVGVLLPNGIDFVKVMLAAAALGVVIVPLNPTLPVQQLRKAFEFSEVKHLIGAAVVIDTINNSDLAFIDGLWLVLGKDFWGNAVSKGLGNRKYELVSLTGNEPYIHTLTSGSTGKPKPIVLTQKNKIDRAKAAKDLYGVTKGDVILTATPLYHSLAERLVLLPLLEGGTSVILSRFTPKIWLETVERHKVTFTIAVSSQLSQIAEVLASPFLHNIKSLRCVVSSSALLETHIKQEIVSKLNCDFHECYGTSEIAIASNINIVETKEKINSVGKAIQGVRIKIVGEHNEELSSNQIGEILCSTPMMFKEYYQLPELTEQSLVDGFFRTGDCGYVDDDNYLYYVDRKKDIIITGGINVYPNDIETHIRTIDGIEDVMAFPYPDSKLGEVVAVAIIIKDSELSMKEIKVSCANNLADFQQPIKYFVVKEFPRNNMGKLDKQKLIRQLLDGGQI